MKARELFTAWLILPIACQLISSQSNTFNSNFTLSADQIQRSNLSQTLINNVEVAINFERSNWATGSVASDPFYTLPSNVTANFSSLAPGTLLKVERFTNTSLYTLAPTLALSRILFTTETFNGSVVPASAYILWPFSPNLQPGTTRVQTVVWAHGTSGSFGECAPSHIRNLWYQYSTPYSLALAGYAVVAPDYQGLGINYTVTPSGETIPLRSPWLGAAPVANDVFYAQQAALQAFPALISPEFVAMGHSQGGGIAWAAAERQASRPVDGYLGAVVGSPGANTTKSIEIIAALGAPFYQAPLVALAAQSVFPEFDLADVVTELGIARLGLLEELGGCASTTLELLGGSEFDQIMKPGWTSNAYMLKYLELTGAGGGAIAGPMLVVTGTADQFVPEFTVAQTVNDTCSNHAESALEYLVVNGTTHVPTLYATQKQWLGWIADRFAGVPVAAGCQNTVLQPYLPIEQYQSELSYYLELATQPYEVA